MLGALGFQFVEKLHSELGSGATEGVSKGDGAAEDVDRRGVEVELAKHRDALARERFVQFVPRDVGWSEACLFQRLWHGVNRSDAHDAWLEAADVVGLQARNGLDVQLFEHALADHHHKGGTV